MVLPDVAAKRFGVDRVGCLLIVWTLVEVEGEPRQRRRQRTKDTGGATEYPTASAFCAPRVKCPVVCASHVFASSLPDAGRRAPRTRPHALAHSLA